MLHHLAHLLCHFCQFPICPGRTRQRVEQHKSKSTQPRFAKRCLTLYGSATICDTRDTIWSSSHPVQEFVKSNERDMSGGGGIVNRRRNEATMALEKKSEELAKNLEAKEREFEVGVSIQ